MIAVLLASAVLAQGGSGADELWERYPLDPKATPTAQAAPGEQPQATERDAGQVQIVETGDGDGDGFGTAGLVALIAVAATGGAAALRFAQLAARKRRVAETGAAPAPAATASPPPAPVRGSSARARSTSSSPPTASPPAPSPPPRTRSTPRPARAAAPAPTRRPPRPPRPVREPAREPVQRAEAAPPTRRFAPSAAENEWEMCRIRLWRGYVTRCYIAQAEGTEAPIARSPSFKAVSTPEATAALQEMVADLRAKGWDQVHDPGGAWHGWMRRPAGMRTSL